MTCLWLTVAAQAQPLESVYFLLEKWLGLVPLFVSFDSLLSRGHNVERLGSDQIEMRPMISPKRTASAEYVIRLLAEVDCARGEKNLFHIVSRSSSLRFIKDEIRAW